MDLNSSFSHLTPEDGCKAQRPKRRDILSQQDEDKSPNKSLYNTIPSSKNLRQKLTKYTSEIYFIDIKNF